MLSRLSIRDIVLIERLDIEFSRGLAVLTGETGAGKSILLDAFALALGGRGDAGLVRHGVEQGQVTASFEVNRTHPARALLTANDIPAEDELILRRVQFADGRTRAFVNDQPVSVQVLKSLGAALVEIHGQHDERALVDASTHRRLLDAFAGLEDDAARLAGAWEEWRAARAEVEAHRARVEGGGAGSRVAAPCGRGTHQPRARTGRGDRARREAHDHDGGREGRRRSARRLRGGGRQRQSGREARRRAAPAGAARRAGARAGRSGDRRA